MAAPDPGWGRGAIRPGIDGEPMGNPAAILDLMRNGGSERATAAYKAACEIWQRLKDAPGLTEEQRRVETIKQAIKSVDPSAEFVAVDTRQ